MWLLWISSVMTSRIARPASCNPRSEHGGAAGCPARLGCPSARLRRTPRSRARRRPHTRACRRRPDRDSLAVRCQGPGYFSLEDSISGLLGGLHQRAHRRITSAGSYDANEREGGVGFAGPAFASRSSDLAHGPGALLGRYTSPLHLPTLRLGRIEHDGRQLFQSADRLLVHDVTITLGSAALACRGAEDAALGVVRGPVAARHRLT